MNTILFGFLSANLLPIGEDDDKLKLLESAAEDLSKEIIGQPILAYRFALVGFDENVAATDPIHKKVSQVIALKWQTMTNKTGGGPVQVHRAVILRSLEIAAESNADLRRAIILISHNLKPGTLDGRAKDCIVAMLVAWESSVAEELNAAWVNTVDMSLPKLSAKVKKAAVSREDLISGLGRAAGPNDKDGKPYPTPNPHWPNAAQPWSYEFAPRAADAVIAAINAGTKGYTEDMQEALRETVSSWSASLERMAMRDAKTELLWIRESGYSPSAKTGFKNLDSTDIILHSIIDVTRTVNKLAPPSVEFFLRDMVAQFIPKRIRLDQILAEIGSKLGGMPEGKAIITNEKFPTEGRRSWLDCAVRGMGSGAFSEQTGVSGEQEDTAGEIAVHFYREFQIRKLLAAKS